MGADVERERQLGDSDVGANLSLGQAQDFTVHHSLFRFSRLYHEDDHASHTLLLPMNREKR